MQQTKQHQLPKPSKNPKTIARKAERNRSVLFYDSANEWDDNPNLDKPRRKPYVKYGKK